MQRKHADLVIHSAVADHFAATGEEKRVIGAVMLEKPTNDPVLTRFLATVAEIYGDRVERVVLFGSRARGDARPDSDTDIMIEIDPAAGIGVYEYVGLKEFIASLFDGPVDVVNRDGLKSYVAPAVIADAIYAF